MEQQKPLSQKICAAFTEHPRQAGESYFQHFLFTLGMSARLLFAGVSLIIHGLFPFLCVHTASKTIRGCHGILHERACKTGGVQQQETP